MTGTCFVLGAGFSVPAELPPQETLLRSPPPEIADIVGKIFNIDPEKHYDEIEKIPLEDIFTFLDRININHELIPDTDIDFAFAYNAKRIILNHIINVFNSKLAAMHETEAYYHFFDQIVRRRIAGESNTVITLNWDTIPEYYIYKSYKNHNIYKAGVDYACYDFDYDDNSRYVQSILRKAKGFSTIKVLKLHGSINWLHSNALGYLRVKEQTGAAPSGLVARASEQREMENILITPTLLKNIENTHLKMIWFNAGIDLLEARRVVFLGYSLALADFDFRYLLLKSICRRKDVKLRVLLYPENASAEKLYKRNQTEARYRNFFIGNNIQYKYMNVKDFMQNDKLIWNW
ncbi:MAG: SIR2 family protein [Spirochaetaceae bacterium]|jgi:hypothetical protein|nr:SIR2 family protein [Spirochaetaceae bacterium]